MPNEPYRGRVFTPAEVRRILSRAAALEDAAGPEGREAGRSHAREEIERIAADAGISAGALQRALEDEGEAAEAPSRPFVVAGAPAHVAIDRIVRGSFGASSHTDLAHAMRRAVGPGEATHTEGRWVWTSSPFGGRRARAIVEPSGDGRVNVRVEESLDSTRRGVFTLAWVVGLAIMVPVVAFLSPEVAHAVVPYLLLAWAVVPYLVARTLYVRRFRGRETELAALVADLGAIVADAAPRVAEPRVRVSGDAGAPEAADSSDGEPAEHRSARSVR